MFSVVLILGPVSPVSAALDLLRFENLVVFGDSLSDNGNYLHSAMVVCQIPHLYFNGRFSNGPNWVDYFPSVASSVTHFGPGTAFYAAHKPNDNPTNFAIGGSTSGVLADQIGAYVTSLGGRSAGSDLCVIWIGANDFAARQYKPPRDCRKHSRWYCSTFECRCENHSLSLIFLT